MADCCRALQLRVAEERQLPTGCFTSAELKVPAVRFVLQYKGEVFSPLRYSVLVAWPGH